MDTPAVKFTWESKIIVPKNLTPLMSGISTMKNIEQNT